MKTRFFFGTILALVAALTLPVIADAKRSGDMHVVNPWARATPPGAPNGAAYMTLMNRGKTPDYLISISSPVAKKSNCIPTKKSAILCACAT